MRYNMIRTGVRVTNKVNGGQYEILQVSKGSAVAGRVAQTEDGKETVNSEDIVKITEKNAICFRYLYSTKPEDVPTGFTVKDGQLFNPEGEPIQQGELKVKEILGAVPGLLALAVVAKNGKDTDFFTYSPSRDTFRKQACEPDYEIISSDENGVLVAYSREGEKVVKDDEGTETTLRIFEGAGLIRIGGGGGCEFAPLPKPITFDPTIVETCSGRKVYIFKSTENVEYDEETDLEVIRPGKVSYFIVDGFDSVEEVEVGFEAEKICFCALNDGFVFRNADNINSSGVAFSTPLIKELDGYDNLVDVTTNGDETTMTFANNGYEVKSITRKSTRDRGNIYTVA